MSCSTRGWIPSPSSAWWPAPPRCLWSTGGREPAAAAPQNKSPRGFHPRASERGAGGDQRFDFLAFFFFFAVFLAAFFAVFLTAFLADFFTADFLPAFLPAFFAFFAFLAFFFGA